MQTSTLGDDPPLDPASVRRSVVRSRWLLGATVAIVSALVWGTWLEVTTHERQQALAAAARRQGNLAVSVGQYLTRALGNADAVADYLSAVYASADADFPARLRDRARANTLFWDMVLCQARGGVVAGGRQAAGDDFGPACATWLNETPQQAQQAQGLVTGPIRHGGRTLIPLLTRLEGNATRPPAVLVLLVDLPAVLGLLQEYSVPDETSVVVARADGLLLARWHSVHRMARQAAPELALLQRVLASGQLGQPHDVAGQQVQASARRLDPYGLVILVTTSIPDTLAPALARSRQYAIAGALANLLLVGFALLLLHLQNQAARTSESLGRARARLQAMNEQLEERVLARTAELEAANRELEDFSYAVAHDVRAPLSAIGGFGEALLPTVEASADPKAPHYLRRILANARQMNELTQALLQLGQIARAPIRCDRIDLSEMAHQVLDSLRERHGGDRVVQCRIQEGMAVAGDAVLLRQVLENVMSNAWKFTARRSPAEIKVHAEGGPHGVTVVVRDNGEGFDSSLAVDVFRPFRRMHKGETFPGTGVGLAIVRKIVERHGGRVRIQSRPEAGTSVFLTLPAPRSDEEGGAASGGPEGG